MRNPEINTHPSSSHAFSQRDTATDTHFGNRLRAHREALGLDLASLADFCGIAALTLEELESDGSVPSLRTLERLCHGLEISLEELLCR